MNKGLEALEKIKEIIREDAEDIDNPRLLVDEIYVIEKELEDYENLKLKHRSMQDAVLNDFKKLKALKIIKEKEVDVSCLLFDGLEVYNENMHPSRIITEEEYDLLKEVLL